MPDPRVVNLARTIVRYSTKVKPKDRVAIVGSPRAAELIRELFREALRAGAYAYPFIGLEMLYGLDGLDEIFFREASEDQLRHVLCTEWMIRTEFDVLIAIRSQTNTHSLSTIDPERQKIWAQARGPMKEIFLRRGASGELRWNATLFPTEAYAQDADMSLAELEDYVYSTTYSDIEDPIAAWQTIHNMQQRFIDWLKGKKKIEVKGPNIDMSLSIEDRIFINSDGTNNMPSGEIFTGPVEDSANGWVRFTYPAVLQGREVSGVALEFKDGRVVKASAAKNEDFLMAMLDVDEGARYLGEWAIGTNKMINRFIKNILFDEKIGGTIHMALGAGYPETGSTNKSAIHWDMICDMRDGGQIFVDDELMYENGEFII